jgi:hypothetical protein
MRPLVFLLFALTAAAQTGKTVAPVDLSGYWVSIVTEDWRYRMQTAPRYDYYGIPLNPEARKVARAWDPAKDPQGESCINYGAPTIMRQPGRVRFTWDNDNVLKVETDAGKQTRTFYFNAPPSLAGEPSLQGISTAAWQTPAAIRGVTGKLSAQDPVTPGFPGINTQGQQAPPPPQKFGAMKVVTTRIRPGYLRSNGVPFGANVSMTEYYDVHKEKNGDEWLVITTIVDDAQYLDVPFVNTTHFRRQKDATGWDPQPCK